jgi:AcrR family transcriptional regulator
MAKIAQQAGVSRATVYYYFDDQQDLVFQCYRRTYELMADSLSKASAEHENTMSAIESFVRGMLGDGDIEFAALSETAFLHPDQRDTILELNRAIRTDLAKLLVVGLQRDEVRPCNSEIVAQTVLGLVCWVPIARRWSTSGSLSHRDLVEAIIAILQEGVAADRSLGDEYLTITPTPGSVAAVNIFNPQELSMARREALLVSASWLFNLKGVDATSLDEVAERVGVTRKVVYNNLGDKETVVIESYRRAFRFYEDVGLRALQTEGPRINAICASTQALCESNLREDLAPLAPLGGLDTLPAEVRDEIQDASMRLRNSYITLYGRGREDGSVRDIPVRAVLAVLPGLSQWLPKWLDILTDKERAAAPREIADLIRTGLRPL